MTGKLTSASRRGRGWNFREGAAGGRFGASRHESGGYGSRWRKRPQSCDRNDYGFRQAPEPLSRFAASPRPLPASRTPWLGSVAPVRTRKLYFSEKLLDPNDPNSATEFYITVEGQTPALFDPESGIPNIVAKQGTVEDWIIENRSSELHAFHIHQLHFMLMDYRGKPVDEPFFRDTVNVPYYDGRALEFPTVRLRMDFRDPNTAGDLCLSLPPFGTRRQGMMGLIRVEP